MIIYRIHELKNIVYDITLCIRNAKILYMIEHRIYEIKNIIRVI